MKIQKTEDLIEWVDGVYNQCGKWSNCAPSFEFSVTGGVMGVGNGISQYNVYDFIGRVSTRDDLCKMLFEVSLRYSIAHIDVNFYQLGENVTFILVLVESPDHVTNIVPEMVDAFLRMFELDKRGRR